MVKKRGCAVRMLLWVLSSKLKQIQKCNLTSTMCPTCSGNKTLFICDTIFSTSAAIPVNYFPLLLVKSRQTDGKRCIQAHHAFCTGGVKMAIMWETILKVKGLVVEQREIPQTNKSMSSHSNRKTQTLTHLLFPCTASVGKNNKKDFITIACNTYLSTA